MGTFPLGILLSGIQIANKLTAGVQSSVTVERWIRQTIEGTPIYDEPMSPSPLCVVDMAQKQIIGRDGKTISIMATLTFIGDIAPNGAVGRQEPFDTRDRITLPSGQVGIIVSAPNSVINPDTKRGLIHTVVLGPR